MKVFGLDIYRDWHIQIDSFNRVLHNRHAPSYRRTHPPPRYIIDNVFK